MFMLLNIKIVYINIYIYLMIEFFPLSGTFWWPFVILIKVLPQIAHQLRANLILCRGGRQLMPYGLNCNDAGHCLKNFHVQNCSSGNETDIQNKHTYFWVTLVVEINRIEITFPSLCTVRQPIIKSIFHDHSFKFHCSSSLELYLLTIKHL